MQDCITLRSAAVYSGLSPRLILELCRLGVIRARVVRGRWHVHREELLAWLAGS